MKKYTFPYLHKTNIFGSILESASLSVCVYVNLSIHLSVYKILVILCPELQESYSFAVTVLKFVDALILMTVFLLINAPRAVQSIDREPLFCTQFAKQKSLSNCVCSTSLLKTLWEKEKLLVMSNFSFFHRVF